MRQGGVRQLDRIMTSKRIPERGHSLTSEIWAAVIGAVLGAALAAGASFMQYHFSLKQREQDKAQEYKLSIVREIMRFRGSSSVQLAMNEIPLGFGDDPQVMDLYRKLWEKLSVEPKTDASSEQANSIMLDLLNELGRNVGLSSNVRASDLKGVFSPAQSETGN